MNTEILYSYQLRDEYLIEKVLRLPGLKCVVLSWKYPNLIKIDVISFEQNEFAVSELPVSDYHISEYHIFSTPTSFGFITEGKQVLLWNDLHAKPEVIRIKNPFPADKFGRKYSVNISTHDENGDSLYFGLEPRESRGFPARYWAKLSIEDSTIFGFNLGKQARWSKEKQLDLKSFPTTEFGKFEDEFLSINKIMIKSDILHVHTIGGSVTRLKSGKSYEFSIISKMKMNGELIRNYPIEEGVGYFSSSKDYFILHNRKNKRLLTFYKTEDLSIEFEISLTPKQNLGDSKFNSICADAFDGYLFIYNASFLNICRMIST